MRFFLLTFLIFTFALSQEYDEAYKLLKSDFLEKLDRKSVYQAIIENRNFAISSYLALKAASFLSLNKDKEDAKLFLDMVDEKSLLKEDLPFYLYVKYINNPDQQVLKNIVLTYPDSYYGYKLYTENLNLFSEDEKVKILETLIKKKMKERAVFLTFTLSQQTSVDYVRLLLASNNQEREDIFKNIDETSPHYLKALKHMASYSKDYERLYLEKISSNREEYEKSVLLFCEKSFYRGEDISAYVNLFPENPQIRWFEFLQLYRNGDYQKALDVIQRYGRHYDRDKYEYWLYLVKKKVGDTEAETHLNNITSKEIKDISQLSYYRTLVDYKTNKRYRFSPEKPKSIDDEAGGILKTLKGEDYRLAYTEAIYMVKTGRCNQVFNTMPEIGVKCFERNSPLTFIKPFGKIDYNENLVYSIIRQESFFDPYAISTSNAVGITQFIPKTAVGFAKKLGIENFDMTHLYNPQLAITFSVEYLKYLDKLWNGNITYMVASYNAGENAVKKFLENNQIEDPAEFVELFPYKETRDYVQKVLRNYIIYNSLE